MSTKPQLSKHEELLEHARFRGIDDRNMTPEQVAEVIDAYDEVLSRVLDEEMEAQRIPAERAEDTYLAARAMQIDPDAFERAAMKYQKGRWVQRTANAARGISRRMVEYRAGVATRFAIERAHRTSALRVAAFRVPPAESNRDRESGSTL